MSALLDHVLQEILSRVGTIKDLLMLAATCRRWLGRFTDRNFLRELLYRCPGQRQGLLGFFMQDARQGVTLETRRKDAARQLASACSFLPAPGSPLGPGPTARALVSSLVADGGGAFDDAVPLAARRGIVLMQCVPRCRDTRLLFGVCNPVTGERHLLAPLHRPPINICGYAIITDADVDADATAAAAGRFTFSQLLVTLSYHRSDWVVHLHSYSAATRSWSAPTQCMVNGRCFGLIGQRSAVVHQGAAHWLWLYDTRGLRCLEAGQDDGSSPSLYKLSVPLGKQGEGAGAGAEAEGCIPFAFTRIPVRAGGNQLLCVTGDGKLAVASMCISHVAVSTCRQHQQAETWERTATFRIPEAVPYPETTPLCFDLSRGSILVLYRSSAVFIVDLHRKTMEKVMDCFLHLFADKFNRTAVPYEMDLVDFFMLKLGGLGTKGRSSSG